VSDHESFTLSRRGFLQSAPSVGLSLAMASASVAGLAAPDPASPSLLAFDRKAWWKTPYRVVQTNLREPDARQDPRTIAREIKEFGGNVIVSNIGGIVAFYPTALQFHWKNPLFEGDFVAGMVKAAHAEGLAYIGRFDLSKAMKPAYDANPDWFMVDRDGAPRTYAGTYQACPNGGWAQEYSAQILREGLTRYDVDGVFFNMSGYPVTDYGDVAHGACVCQNCRRLFREMYQRELPEKDGFTDPAWIDYLEFQSRTSRALGDKNYALIKSLRPEAAVVGYFLPYDVGRGEIQRRVNRSPPEWAYQSGAQSRASQAGAPGKAFSATSAAHIDYPWRQALETADCHILRFAQQLATGASLDLYLMGTFADQNDRRFIGPVAELYKWHAAKAGYYQGLRPAARIALYESSKTEKFGGATPSGNRAPASFRGAYSLLVDARIPFWIVSDERVADGTTKLTAQDYDAIILPHVGLLDDAEAAALDEYVKSGGLIIATGETGAYAEHGERRQMMPMKSSPVAAFTGSQNAHGWTFNATHNAIDLGGARIPADAEYFNVAVRDTASNLLQLAPEQRFGPPELSYALAGATGGPQPGILVTRYGKGQSIHIPWLPEWQYYRDGLPDHRIIFTSLLTSFAPLPEVKLIGNGPIELTVQKQESTGRRLVHLINYAGQRNTLYEKPPELIRLRLGLRGTHERRVDALVSSVALTARTQSADKDGYVWFDLPPLGAFEVISIAGA
jgi:hypothetical protein